MEELLIEDYNYPLPDERIAKYPLAKRDESELLIYQNGDIRQDKFLHLGTYLPKDTLLIYNNTKVIQARLLFHKATGAKIEIFCLEPLIPHDYQLNLSATGGCRWKCMVGNLKKWKQGTLVQRIHVGTKDFTLQAALVSSNGNVHQVDFSWDAPDISFAEILDAGGILPIPPYLNRETEESDKITYQTVYSNIKGSVAAPTAGLHFTKELLQELRGRGIQTAELTLHVGAGTFQPVKTADANLHTMHTEIIAVPKTCLQEILDNVGHICAVGTTSMRTLESLYHIGVKLSSIPQEEWNNLPIHVQQFEPYTANSNLTAYDAVCYILKYLDHIGQNTLHAETQIMIKPGYDFKIVDMLITNFHQPKSTLLLLVSAFIGEDWRKVYQYALSNKFRFLSYGDSSLLFRNNSLQS
ncbi:MAG TPA: S-adenosylmethionine tRNA ribosyltransferase [Bacteroidales bacterium]|nr:S-adenosylmethionine tRNA ribosyltransferase [Bacteroidales bacterium]